MTAARFSFLLAPGAGAPSSHARMQDFARLLAAIWSVKTIEYAYVLAGRRRPDPTEFSGEYQAALKTIKARLNEVEQPQHATLGWLAREYEASYEFQKKSPRDQRTIHLIHRSVLDDETEPGSGELASEN
jgi:hypothetical protein